MREERIGGRKEEEIRGMRLEEEEGDVGQWKN